MSLRNPEAFSRWVQQEQPDQPVITVVLAFVLEILSASWRAPSIPIPELSDQPDSEVRSADLDASDGTAVTIWYRHFYGDDDIEILGITQG